ncbi:MAG: conjugal transfer protein TraF [Anaerolineae bacterium]|nr:conjugal transfer protein TraF [Anaerolineae bacterium]
MGETALLVYENGLAEGQEVDVGAVLSHKPAFILGSDARCQLTLLDPQVAPSHTSISFDGQHYTIKPTLPRLAFYVNGEAVEHVTVLHPGDRVQVGDTVLRFAIEERDSAAAPNAIKLAVMPARSVSSSPPIAATPTPKSESGRAITPTHSAMQMSSVTAVTSVAAPTVYFPTHDAQNGTNLVAIVGSLGVLVAVLGFVLVMVGNLNTASGSTVQSIPANLATGENATLIMFEASWCTYCAQQKPIVNRLEREYVGLVDVRHVDIDDMRNQRLVSEYNARSIPLLVVMDRNQEVIAIFRGLQREETIRQALEMAIL